MSRFIDPRPKYVHEGATVANGKLYFWQTGTSIFKDTWSDPGLTTKNTNPVDLDGDGRVPDIWLQGTYSVALYTSGGITEGSLIFSIDGYEGSTASAQYGDWSNITTYSVGDFVKASDGKYYQSLQNNNLGQNPTATPTYWIELGFITIYNANKTYANNDVTLYEGVLFQSIQAANTGNAPDVSPTWWQSYIGSVAASDVSYDNASSGLTATAAQAAIDELASEKADAADFSNVNNTSDANKPVSTAQQTALNLKADLASPALTDTPTAPTAAASTNTTQIATTAFVQQEVDAESETVELGGTFTAGESIKCARRGDMVTITSSTGVLSHSSSSAPSSTSGVIPAAYRPTSSINMTYLVSSDIVYTIAIASGGQFTLFYRTVGGTIESRTDSNAVPSISFVV